MYDTVSPTLRKHIYRKLSISIRTIMRIVHFIGQAHRQMTRRIYTKPFTVVISGEEAGPAGYGIEQF